MTSLEWEYRPQLRDPVLVAAFTGWNDAGDAASDAVAWLARQFSARPFATIDPDEHYDFQANRPEVELVDGVTRRISWPTMQFAAAPVSGDGTDLVLLSGPDSRIRSGPAPLAGAAENSSVGQEIRRVTPSMSSTSGRFAWKS